MSLWLKIGQHILGVARDWTLLCLSAFRIGENSGGVGHSPLFFPFQESRREDEDTPQTWFGGMYVWSCWLG